jgi:hypothetical protein
MGDHQQRVGTVERAAHAAAQGFGVERAEAFVEDHQVRPLQQRPHQKQAAAFAVRDSRQSISASIKSSDRGGQPRPISRLKAKVPVNTWFS